MRTKLSIAVVVAALLAVAGVTLASAASGGSPNDHAGRVIKLFSVLDQEAILNLDKSDGTAPTVGDQDVFSDKISDRQGGPPIGTDGGVCSIVNVDAQAGSAVAHCAATLSLPGGQIAGQGLVTVAAGNALPEPFDLPITGGTGDYEGAGGHLTVQETSEKEAILTVHLDD
jgi:hypothetical protein